jgi:hypothetical protein
LRSLAWGHHPCQTLGLGRVLVIEWEGEGERSLLALRALNVWAGPGHWGERSSFCPPLQPQLPWDLFTTLMQSSCCSFLLS